jgi:hypothetical protein
MALGTTRIDERIFNEFLDETGKFYTAERYHLLGQRLLSCSLSNVNRDDQASIVTLSRTYALLFSLDIQFPKSFKVRHPRAKHLAIESLTCIQYVDLPIDFVSTTIGWLTNPIIQSIYKTALHKEVTGNATLRAMSNDGGDDKDASYGQAISSAASSTGRAALSVGGKALRLVMNTSNGIAGSSNISGWSSSS